MRPLTEDERERWRAELARELVALVAESGRAASHERRAEIAKRVDEVNRTLRAVVATAPERLMLAHSFEARAT